MDVFDKFFKKFAYKFPKGYPDLNNPHDKILLESILSELGINIFEVTNREISSNTKKAIQYIINNTDLGFKTQTDIRRLGNPEKVSGEEFQNIIKDLLGATNIEVYAPRTGPNPSGKFDMYEFDTKDFGPVKIILSGGGNLGEKYEQDFVAKAKQLAGIPNEDLPDDLQTLYNTLKIDNEELSPNDISFAGATDTKRSLDLRGPQDVGETISDLTIKANGKSYFISLKNKSGSGIYSGKNIPFIYEKDDEIIYDPSKRESDRDIDIIFDIFNIDEERLAQGLNNYVNQTGEVDNYSSININEEDFKNILASSFGYGYYYVREVGKDQVKVVPILTKEDAIDAVGDIKSTEIKYPGPNTKQLTINTITDSPLFGVSKYSIAVRNTQGKLLPLSLRISKVK